MTYGYVVGWASVIEGELQADKGHRPDLLNRGLDGRIRSPRKYFHRALDARPQITIQPIHLEQSNRHATMATKSAKAGDKRKAAEAPEKKVKKFEGKKEGLNSTRKLFKNEDASDDSSDDELSDGEDGGAELPAKKKAKQSKESEKPASNDVTDKKHERSRSCLDALVCIFRF